MNTHAHLVLGAALFAKPNAPKVNTAAILGSLAPDISLYFMVFYSMLIMGIEPTVVFGELYYSTVWQTIFAIDNSFFLWGFLLIIGFVTKIYWVKVFAAVGITHLIFDFPLHHDDGRAHFQPLSDWVFNSPISYWDPQNYGVIVGFFEVILVIGLCAILFRRFTQLWVKIGTAIIAVLELLFYCMVTLT